MKLSRRESETLDFIKSFSARIGRAPYQREICEHLGIMSRGFVQRILGRLEQKGTIVRVPFEVAGIMVREIEPARPTFLASDVWSVVKDYARAKDADPEAVLADWVRERAEYEMRAAA